MSDDLGSTLPARLRITAWIVLATAIGLTAVVLTMRSAEITDTERSANRDLAQELDEFRAFAAEAVDPETGAPYASARGLLERHLAREYPSVDEVLVGYVEDGAGPELVVGSAPDPVGLGEDPQAVRALVTGEEPSGIARTEDGARYRWAIAQVQPTGADGAPVAGPPAALLVAVTTETERAEVAEQVRLAVLVSLGGLVVTAGIALVVAGKILEPVRAVSRTAARISRSALDERIPVGGRDDLAQLTETINAMLDRLQHALEAHRRSAAAASRHIRPSLDRLAARTEGRDRAEVDRIGGILDDLALLAESEGPDFARPAHTDLPRLADDLLAAVRTTTGRDWRLEERAEGEAVLDRELTRQAVLRLAENAAAADADGPLRLGVARTGDTGVDTVTLWVADDGPGLEEADAAHAFDRYGGNPAEPVAADADGRRGPGLGLAVVRAVADAHGGSAWVETTPGAGARFGLDLPAGGSR